MKKKHFNVLKKELVYLGMLLVFLLIVLQAAFYKQNILTTFKLALSLTWLFILPGYCILLYWHHKINFIERIVAGTVIAAGIMGMFSYYLGIVGLTISAHTILLPILFVAAGLFAFSRT